MRILVFLHGTVLMHRTGRGKTRKERVRQVLSSDSSVVEYRSYIPIDDAVAKLQKWAKQGADILYLSSHTDAKVAKEDAKVLEHHKFPKGQIFYRAKGERYADVIERVKPDVLIEDTCESIGGEGEMSSPHVSPALKKTIRIHVVLEFGGIDHLPDTIADIY
ncbi:MAG: hypothetical protein V1926_03350 [Candidatus Peregrinibacteria bacterium]